MRDNNYKRGTAIIQSAQCITTAIKTMESIEGKEEVSRCILLGAVRDDLTAHSGYKKLTTYRRGLAISFLEEFFESLHPCSDTTENDKLDCKRTSSQSYQKVNDEQPQYDEVERPIPHVCSAEQGKHILKLIKLFLDQILRNPILTLKTLNLKKRERKWR